MSPRPDEVAVGAPAAGEPLRYLDPEGRLMSQPGGACIDTAGLVAGYKAMVLARMFDEKAIALQRTGRLGTYASCLGQEAVGVGLAQAMGDDDVLLPSFREQAAQLLRGVTMQEILVYWGGDERGSDFQNPKARVDFPVSIPVASHFPHAVGVGLAFRMRGQPRVAVAVGGDGSTSKGDFYEAINMAAVWKAPVVFVVTNNQWAISVPLKAQTVARTLADKAVAAGMPGERVDGNDLIAVRDAMMRAIARARAGNGPVLLECITYRLGDHTTADDAARYRKPEEVGPHWKEEPVARLRNYLVAIKAWSKSDELNLIDDCRARVDAAADAYLAVPAAGMAAMFDHMYQDLPAELERQKAEAAAMEGGHA